MTTALSDRFGDKLSFVEGSIDLLATVKSANLIEVATALRDEPTFAFDGLMCLSAVDRPPDATEVVYNLTSYAHNHRLTVKVIGPRENPVFPTVSDVWPTANWFEREATELFGITFEGHPDPRPLLLDEDWDEGPPMRRGWQGRDFIPMPER
jgi:NADH:ubiquinone oxidoreductase subunit C